MSTDDLFILARSVCAHVCVVLPGAIGCAQLCMWMHVAVRVDACVRGCTWGGCPMCVGTGLARAPVSCVKGLGILYNPNT